MSLSTSRTSISLRLAALAALLSAPAFADVYVVDDDGGAGVDFTDLPAAVAAAQPGDVLLVGPGVYSAFTLSEGVAVLAQSGGAQVAAGTQLLGLPAGQIASLVGLSFDDLLILSCPGVVLLDGVTVSASGTAPQALNVITCADVRVIESLATFSQWGPPPPSGSFPSGHALRAMGSRVELVASQVQGRFGAYGGGAGDGGAGGHGATLGNGARVHLVRSEALGGKGGDGSPLCFPTGTFGGTGGDGIEVQGSSTLLAMGDVSLSKIFAGWGGGCCFPGADGSALTLGAGCFARYSGQSVQGSLDIDPAATLETPAPADPYLERFGTPLVGGQVRFNVHGQAGDVVTLFLGRSAVVQPLPGVLVEKLTSEQRAINLGTLPADGFATLVFKFPPQITEGFILFAQARLLRGSQELRTNSIPVVVR